MQSITNVCFTIAALLTIAPPRPIAAQQPSTPPPSGTIQGGFSPLQMGISDLTRKDYAGAQTFFTNYLAATPNDPDARLFLGAADLGLKDVPSAIKEFQTVAAAQPTNWSAHQNLVRAYALTQDWSAFDKERDLLKSARDHNAPNLDKTTSDLIDTLQVGTKAYRVLYFYTLTGRFHTRYVFAHFGDDGKPTDYIACESDDTDQYFFKQKHPDLAAAGQRSFSLDTYSNGPNGQSQGLIKFYPDGEPTYETVRADALKVLQAQANAATK
jgi:tetratricopeptide (TPR) repeat protein